MIVDRFLYCRNTSETLGGSPTHTHKWGASYCGWYTEIHGRSGDAMHFMSDSWWNNNSNVGNVTQRSWYASSEDHSMAAYNNVGNTGGASSLPPYITCYAWYRTA